jgi:hypothetical protein
VKCFNNMVEQDHRAVKRVTRSMLGFKSFAAAHDTLVGIELMHMMKKRPMVVEAGEEGLTAAALFYSLAASSPPRQRQLPLHGPLSSLCDRALFSAPYPEPPLIAWGGAAPGPCRACGQSPDQDWPCQGL